MKTPKHVKMLFRSDDGGLYFVDGSGRISEASQCVIRMFSDIEDLTYTYAEDLEKMFSGAGLAVKVKSITDSNPSFALARSKK